MLALALVLALAPSPPSQRLVKGTGLRVRAAPDANAAVVERVPLGSVLPCLEESRPVTVGAVTAPFCKTPKGWYFTALTTPLTNRAAQVDALVDARIEALAGVHVAEENWADLYEVHNLLRVRIDERSGEAKLQARLAELAFVSTHANAFAKDPRVAMDDSQGPRVKNAEFDRLVEDAARAGKGSRTHEDAAWAVYQHGWGGECEGDTPCVLDRLHKTACAFLAQFPAGGRAQKAMADVVETLRQQADFEAKFPPARDAAVQTEVRAALANVKSCVTQAKEGDTKQALALVDAAAQRWR